MSRKEIYTALSRATKLEYIHLDFKKLWRPHTDEKPKDLYMLNVKRGECQDGKVYEVIVGESVYIGSTCNSLDDRLTEHMVDTDFSVYKHVEKTEVPATNIDHKAVGQRTIREPEKARGSREEVHRTVF